MRKATLSRETKETSIAASINIDGDGVSEISTGIGFLDHMLDLLSKHGGFDIKLTCKGDLNVDGHHTVEDIGIVLGQVFDMAVGDKMGIKRYGTARIPMDEALVSVDLDISGRPYLVINSKFMSPKVGSFDTMLVEEFFRAFSQNSKITLHINCEYGKNDHHIIEGMFKALARALRTAVSIDERFANAIPSTKGVL